MEDDKQPVQVSAAVQEEAGSTEERRLEHYIGSEIRRLRKRHGLTVAEMAQQAGLSQGMLSKIENGQVAPSLSTLSALAEAMNVPISAFFTPFEQSRDVTYVPKGQGLDIDRRGTRAGHLYKLLGHGVRGEVAAWLLLGFGLAYTAWGLRAAARNRPHTHWHSHADGTVHDHTHIHRENHAHVHGAPAVRGPLRGTTPWVLFVIFIFGPCEALIPMLMVPAASGAWWGVAMVVMVFGVTTVATMLVAVTVGYTGISRIALGRLERYSHALAGLALVACGLAIQLGL